MGECDSRIENDTDLVPVKNVPRCVTRGCEGQDGATVDHHIVTAIVCSIKFDWGTTGVVRQNGERIRPPLVRVALGGTEAATARQGDGVSLECRRDIVVERYGISERCRGF